MKDIRTQQTTPLARIVCMIAAAMIGFTTALPAAQTATQTKGPTPLEQALTRWRKGDKPGAVAQFLNIDWQAGPAFSPGSPLATREKDLPALSDPAREKLMAEVMASLRDLKQLGGAVKEKATSAGSTDSARARSYLATLDQCGAALDAPEALKILQLTGKALRKMSGAESKKP